MPISSSVTITKKIVSLNIDVENQKIVFVIRERVTDALNTRITDNFKDAIVTGSDFVGLISTMGDNTKNLYDNIADVSYSYLQNNGHV